MKTIEKAHTSHKSRAVLATSIFCLLAIIAAPLLAQQTAHEAHQAIGWVPLEMLQRPVPLRQGMGKVHEKVTTSSPQAQAFYDQGLAYLYSYVWIEAARSFFQAVRLDPSLAMAYIGLSDAFLGLQNYGAANAAVEKAQSFAAKVTERERRRIEIAARQMEVLKSNQDPQKYLAYRTAISDALASDPTNPWLWVLRGFADEGGPLGRGQSGGVDTIAFYETAIRLSPDNFAVHHFLVHSLENVGRTADALEHAEIYARLAPAIPHAHHMVGHELRRAGRTEEAIQQFRAADDLENSYYRSEHVSAELDWHHAHNLRLMAMCYQTLGQMKTAERMFREEFSQPAHTDAAEFNRREWPEFLLNRGHPQEALEAAQSLTKSRWALGRFAGHTVAGRALLAMDRMQDAKDELTLAERTVEEIPAAAVDPLFYVGTLRAEILLRENKKEQGEALMKEIEQGIRAVAGPDAWSEGLFQLESIAQLARQIGDWELAEFTAQQMVQQDPSYAGSYYALALVTEHQGDAAQARQQFAQAEKLWSKADPDLPELQHVRQQLAARR